MDSIKRKHHKYMFSKQEDDLLRSLVAEYGDKDWDLISSFIKGRNRRQCRERWKKFLCPSLNNSPWTQEEDELLLERYETFGPKWVTISKAFKNRTDINVKSRFLVLMRSMKKKKECSVRQTQQVNFQQARNWNDSLQMQPAEHNQQAQIASEDKKNNNQDTYDYDFDEDDYQCIDAMLAPIKDMENQMQMNLWRDIGQTENGNYFMNFGDLIF